MVTLFMGGVSKKKDPSINLELKLVHFGGSPPPPALWRLARGRAVWKPRHSIMASRSPAGSAGTPAQHYGISFAAGQCGNLGTALWHLVRGRAVRGSGPYKASRSRPGSTGTTAHHHGRPVAARPYGNRGDPPCPPVRVRPRRAPPPPVNPQLCCGGGDDPHPRDLHAFMLRRGCPPARPLTTCHTVVPSFPYCPAANEMP